ncbi:AraC family ligand binding domain-containing protein [Paenibacillus yanchengensis]|uniref:AraC family ligand binding domain-containing protein n=1 Tax=Paenibacillus yanchengensis TaxID=2035833 RepID=A0ABW4YGP2_9BACL
MNYSYKVASATNVSLHTDSDLHILFAGESQTKPDHLLGPKVYDFYLMHIVLAGKGTFTINRQQYSLQAGDAFLISPEQLIKYQADHHDPWRYRWVAFQGSKAKQLVQSAGFSEQTAVQHIAAHKEAALLFRYIYRSLQRDRAVAQLRSTSYLQLFLSLYMEQFTVEQSLLDDTTVSDEQRLQQQIVHYLSSQYTEPVSIEQMAVSLGYNRAYLSRIFKKQTGITPISFLLRLRLDRAKLLLRERHDLTVEQVAASVGLQDALYFSKQFRKTFQQSPSEYRKTMLEKESEDES